MQTNYNTTAALLHLSVLTQYCIPFGNFIFPLVIWSSLKEKSELIDRHGKEAINFQLSLLVYTIVVAIISIPLFMAGILENLTFRDFGSIVREENISFDGDFTSVIATVGIAAIILTILKLAEFILVIVAAVKAANNEEYRFPITIRFIK